MENSLRASRIHPRCGTSFIIIVLIASILIHSVFPRPDSYFVRLALHLALIPVVAGFAYEVIRIAGRYRKATFLQALLAPGLWSQRLTTREPDASQVEVASCWRTRSCYQRICLRPVFRRPRQRGFQLWRAVSRNHPKIFG